MHNYKKVLLGIVALLLVFGASTPSFAAEKKSDKPNPADMPIVVQADKVYYNDKSGDMSASGNVVVTQDVNKLETALATGNTKENIVRIDGDAAFTQPGVHLNGIGTIYNYKDRTGTMNKATGKVGKELVTGQQINILPAEVMIQDGTMTTCPAKVPDYHVSADRVEIWPGDKLIAYNAKFWIKDKVIFTMAKYKKSLKEGAESDFPGMGYESDGGFYISQYLDYPLTPNISAFAKLTYWSELKFKPVYGFKDSEPNYSMTLQQGDFRDGDGNWIKKEPEFNFSYNPRRIGKLPVQYSFTAVYGKWTDSLKSSWHQDYNLYFSGDPIKLGKSMSLSLGTGFERVIESYNNSTQGLFRYDATLTKTFSPRLSTWVGYHYTRNNNTLFEYDKTDLAKELDTGFSYRIDKMNAISFNQSYDIENHRVFDQDYTWNRNLHCWEMNITYRARRHELHWDFSVARW